MEFSVKSGVPEKQRSACVIVGVFESRRLSTAAAQVDAASDGQLSAVLKRGDDRLQQSGASEAVCYLPDLAVKGRNSAWRVREAVQCLSDAAYRFEAMKSETSESRRGLRKLVLSVPGRRDLAAGEQALREGEAIAKGMDLAKDLGNLPGNVCTPEYLANQADELGKNYPSIEVDSLGPEAMAAQNMGGLLSVAHGSSLEPRLIVMHYRGGDAGDKPYALVGKGVTFDSGGISIKPAAAMDEMKYDMCGAASVFGTVRAAAELELPINVVGVVAAVENMPDGSASRPGDVVTTMSGQTVEILNTDAEGRLALCDALTYVARYEPVSITDIATLTGACIIALGHHAHGLMGNTPGHVNDLLGAGRQAADRAWELPLWEEYDEQLKSNFADFAHIGGRSAGTITAGCYLSRFTRKQRWAHLDIAGTAWLSGEQKGGTGRPVPLLTQYLLDRVPAADG